MRRKILALGSLVVLWALNTAVATAGEIGHYAPGVLNIRDLAVQRR